MKKVILTIAVIVSGLMMSCQKNELTATEVIMCQQEYDHSTNSAASAYEARLISYTEYKKLLDAAKQKYDNCIIESEGN